MNTGYSSLGLTKSGSAEINIIPSSPSYSSRDKEDKKSGKDDGKNDGNDIDDDNDANDCNNDGPEITYDDIPTSGCLLSGCVYEFRNMPSDRPEENNQSFFRILYAEGSKKSSSSSLLSARTPIFTSNPLYYDETMSWNENNLFHLEIPTSPSDIVGEMIIAIYKVKTQGGNEFIGQASFNLSSLYTNGLIEFPHSNSESRRFSGNFPIITRLTSFAQVSMKLEMIWRKSSVNTKITPNPNTVYIPKTGIKDEKKTKKMMEEMSSGISVGSRSSSPNGSTRISRSISNSTRPKSMDSSKSPSNSNVRKIASAGWKKKREDQMRIERENKIMHSKLQKLAVTKNQNSNLPKPYAVGNISKNSNNPPTSAASNATANGAIVSDKDLLELLNKLKQDIVDKSNDNANLKGQLNKLKSHTTKFQMANERIKKAVSSSVDSKLNISQTSENENDEKTINDDNSNEGDVNESSGMNSNRKKSSNLYHNNMESNKKKALDRSDTSWIYEEYGLEESKIRDKELLDIIDEHCILQNLRRNLVYRIGTASKLLQNHADVSKSIDYGNISIIRRLKAWYPQYTTFLPMSMSSLSSSSSVSLPVSMNDDRNNTDFKKEKEVYTRLIQSQQDYMNLQGIYDEGLHRLREQGKLEELQSICDNLKEMKENVTRQVDNCQYERDLWQERLQTAYQNKSSIRIKDSLTLLKTIQLRLDREQRISDLITNSS